MVILSSFSSLRFSPNRSQGIQQLEAAQQYSQHRCNADIAHAGGQTHRHREEQVGDLLGAAGHRAETDQTECPHYRDAGADVAVDQHDDDLHNRGQGGKRDEEAFGIPAADHAHAGDDSA